MTPDATAPDAPNTRCAEAEHSGTVYKRWSVEGRNAKPGTLEREFYERVVLVRSGTGSAGQRHVASGEDPEAATPEDIARCTERLIEQGVPEAEARELARNHADPNGYEAVYPWFSA